MMLCRQKIVLMLVIAAYSAAGAQQPASSSETVMPTVPSALVAVVDGLPILYGDVSYEFEQRLKQMLASGQPAPEDQIAQARRMNLRQQLRRDIQTKMFYRAFIRKMVGTESEEKREEMEKMMMTNVRKAFYEERLPQLLEQHGVESIADADKKFRELGSSIAQQERAFIESVIAQQYIQGEFEQDPEIPLPDMKFYYNENQAKFSRKARARWEQLTVYFSNFESKADAYAKIIAMGNEAVFGGNVQAVARKQSEEPKADETGGLHDWTRKGSLASDLLDKQIFELPLNKMSQIIEDDLGFHIVRVLDRKPAGTIPFSEAQEEIRKTLQDVVRLQQQKDLVRNLEKRIPVWTIFPDDVPESYPLVASGDVPKLR